MTKSAMRTIGTDLFKDNDDYINIINAISLLQERGFIKGEFDPFTQVLVPYNKDAEKL